MRDHMDAFVVPAFEAKEPTVIVRVIKTRSGKSRSLFVGTGRIKDLGDRKVLAGFNGIFPSRNPDDTDSMLMVLEDMIFNKGEKEGSENILGQQISWSVR